VQTVSQAREAAEAGADVIVAQGAEAGGHGMSEPLFTLLPQVVDACPGALVVAAGGIADGRGMAAVLMLGAQGVVMGTRFYASQEAVGHPEAKRRIAEAEGGQTVRSIVFDLSRRMRWPAPYTRPPAAQPPRRNLAGSRERIGSQDGRGWARVRGGEGTRRFRRRWRDCR
jgi:nitronate monooxygenase